MKKREAILALRAAQLQKGHLRTTRKTYRGREPVNPKTVKQALNALVFFYKNVLDKDPGKLRVPRINHNRNHPTFLQHHEVVDLLSRMRGTSKLQASLLYGTGSRINALLTLRLKDLDLDRGIATAGRTSSRSATSSDTSTSTPPPSTPMPRAGIPLSAPSMPRPSSSPFPNNQ